MFTEMTCATAERTAIAPNIEPTSEVKPLACRHTAPRECRVGLAPDVKLVTQESMMKILCQEVGKSAISKSANASTVKKNWQKRWSKRNPSSIGTGSPLRDLGLK